MSQIQLPFQGPMRLTGEFVVRRRQSHKPHHFKTKSEEHFIVKKPCPKFLYRGLITEWIANRLLSHLGFLVPSIAEAYIFTNAVTSEDKDDPSLMAIRFPCNPELTPIFDLIPDTLWNKVCNPYDCIGIEIADWWLCNNNHRQTLFVRNGEFEPNFVLNSKRIPQVKTGYVCIFVGNSNCFGGKSWNFSSEEKQGYRPRFCADNHSRNVRAPWISKIRDVRAKDLDDIFHSLPNRWLSNLDIAELDSLKRRPLNRASIIDNASIRFLRKPNDVANNQAKGTSISTPIRSLSVS